MSKRQTAADIIMNGMLYSGGEWKSRREWVKHFESDGFTPQNTSDIIFYISQHQPTKAEIDTVEAMIKQRTSELQREIIALLNNEIERRLSREAKVA